MIWHTVTIWGIAYKTRGIVLYHIPYQNAAFRKIQEIFQIKFCKFIVTKNLDTVNVVGRLQACSQISSSTFLYCIVAKDIVNSMHMW